MIDPCRRAYHEAAHRHLPCVQAPPPSRRPCAHGACSGPVAQQPASPRFRPLVRVGNGQLPHPTFSWSWRLQVRRLMVGRYAPQVVCSGQFRPMYHRGPKHAQFVLSGGREYAAPRDYHPLSRLPNGAKRGERVRRGKPLRVASRKTALATGQSCAPPRSVAHPSVFF